MQYRRFFWLLLTICFSAPAVAQEQAQPHADGGTTLPAALTIEQALDEAVQSNLSLLAERVNLTIAEASLITAGLRPNPVFSLSGDHMDWLGTGFNSRNNGGPPEISWRVDVPIERGGKRELRIETAILGKAAAEARLLESIRSLRMDVALACIEVLQAKATLALATDNLRTFEDVVRINEVKVKDGAIAPLELTRSQVAMLQFRATLKRNELELRTAKTKLQLLLGRKSTATMFDVVGELKTPLRTLAQSLSALQEAAYATRPDILTLERTQGRSQADLKLQLAQAKVDLTWGLEYRRQEGVSGRGNTLGVFLSVPAPIFNRNQGEIARALAEGEQVGRQLEALKAQVRTEVQTAHDEFTTARELVDSIEKELLQPAQQARDTVAYTYRVGASSLLEFLDAQRALNETMQSYLEAQASYRRAVIKLNAALGKEVTT
jgi:cobalt-zinc-cadmium efflux system outer membrane protein